MYKYTHQLSGPERRTAGPLNTPLLPLQGQTCRRQLAPPSRPGLPSACLGRCPSLGCQFGLGSLATWRRLAEASVLSGQWPKSDTFSCQVRGLQSRQAKGLQFYGACYKRLIKAACRGLYAASRKTVLVPAYRIHTKPVHIYNPIKKMCIHGMCIYIYIC